MDELIRVLGGDKVYGAAAEASAGDASAIAAGLFSGEFNERVCLRATGFVVVSHTGMGLIHQLSKA